jgi:hypothetical protein
VRIFQVSAKSKEIGTGFIAVMGRTLDRISVGDELASEKGAAFTVYQIDAFGKEVDTISPFADCGLVLEGSALLRDGEYLVKR